MVKCENGKLEIGDGKKREQEREDGERVIMCAHSVENTTDALRSLSTLMMSHSTLLENCQDACGRKPCFSLLIVFSQQPVINWNLQVVDSTQIRSLASRLERIGVTTVRICSRAPFTRN